MDEGFVVGLPVSDFVLPLWAGNACVIRMIRGLFLPLSKSSIYTKKPCLPYNKTIDFFN